MGFTNDETTDTRRRTKPGDLILGAARMRNEATAGDGSRPVAHDLRRADTVEARAREALPERLAIIGAGGELVPHGSEIAAPAVFRQTLRKPDYVTASASRDRLDLLHESGCLEAGLDTADTINAENSIEQMLAHQMAAGHRATMKLLQHLNRAMERMSVLKEDMRAQANIEATRLAGGISRLMTTSQQGALTLQKLKTGGKQHVVVQHVNVESGRQAIVAGAVGAGGGLSAGGGEIKNEG